MYPLIVQTGSVPELIYVLQRLVQSAPVRVLALDSQNVRQYLRGLENLQIRYFRNSRDAEAAMQDWKDSSTVYYIGGSAFPFIQRKVRRLFSSPTVVFPQQCEDWPAFHSRFQSQLRRDAVLLVQTESAELIEEYLRETFPQHHFTRPSLSMLCHQEELPHWQRMHTDWRFWTYGSLGGLPRLVPELRRQYFDACVVFFTGNSDFTKVKALALTCGARQKIAVNEYQQFIEVSPASLLRFGLQRWRHGVVPKWNDATRVLIVQSGDESSVRTLFRRLKEIEAFSKARYSLLANKQQTFSVAETAIDQLLHYPTDRGLFEYLRFLSRVRKQRFDAVVVAFAEPPARKLKWLPFLAGIKHKLIFNRHTDCFFYSARKFLSYWAGRHAGVFGVTRVLIVQTWDEARMRRIFERLQQGFFFRRPRYYLLTREDKAAAFSDLPQIHEILTYRAGAGLVDYWRSLRNLRKLRFDAAIMAFTEEPTYRKLKWVPFLAGIPNKLIFNRHYDCFFFTPGRFLDYWVQRYSGQVEGFRSSAPRLFWSLFLPVLRGLLFPLRFFYLVMTITVRQLRRAYNSQR